MKVTRQVVVVGDRCFSPALRPRRLWLRCALGSPLSAVQPLKQQANAFPHKGAVVLNCYLCLQTVHRARPC